MQYEILGSVRLVDETGVSVVSSRRLGVLLASLLIRADEIVSSEQLINEIWADSPPRRVTATLHVHVSQLRKFLKRPGQTDSPIRTERPGYLLRTAPDTLDLHAFQRLFHQGREWARAEQHDKAVGALEAALSLYRGSPLANLRGGPLVEDFVSRFEEARIECAETFIESSMALGHYRGLIGPLRTLISEYPLHETFYRQLMLALHQCGRRADALSTYQLARDTIRQELGLEPCANLRDLQRLILLPEGDRQAVAVQPR